MPISNFDISFFVSESRRKQELPDRVEDAATPTKVATLLAAAHQPQTPDATQQTTAGLAAAS